MFSYSTKELAYSYHLVCTMWINAKVMPTNDQAATAVI